MTWKIILCAFLLLFIGTIDLDAQTVVLPPTPSIIRKASSVSTGSVASLFAGLFATSPGNSIILCVGVGNGTAPTVTDTQCNTFIQATQIANASTPSATVGVGEPWAVAVACFKTAILPVQGSMILSPPTVSTFWSGIVGLVPATSATDLFTIIGSATRKILIIKVYVACTQTTAGTIDVQFVKRSTADTGGTSTTPALVPFDSGDPTATAVANAYTANPTLGTIVGVGWPYKLACLATGTATPTDMIYERFGEAIGAPIQLNSAAEQFAISLCNNTACSTGQTVSGGNFDIWIEFIER